MRLPRSRKSQNKDKKEGNRQDRAADYVKSLCSTQTSSFFPAHRPDRHATMTLPSATTNGRKKKIALLREKIPGAASSPVGAPLRLRQHPPPSPLPPQIFITIHFQALLLSMVPTLQQSEHVYIFSPFFRLVLLNWCRFFESIIAFLAPLPLPLLADPVAIPSRHLTPAWRCGEEGGGDWSSPSPG